MKQLYFPVLVLFAVLAWPGCKDDPEEDNKFDRGLILKNAADELIIPAYRDFSTLADSLHVRTLAFTEAPGGSSLSLLRTAWQNAKLSWSHAEIFSFGPVDELLVETAINLWPSNIAGIETSVAGYNGSGSYLLSVARNRRGLPAMEYLLFDGSDEQVVEAFTNDPNRRAYLELLAQEIKTHAQSVLNSWLNSYKTTFVKNTGNDANASITLLVNEMIGLLETVKNFKVATPAGIRTQGAPLPLQVESYYARQSLACIGKNLDAIQAVFTGGTGNGFDDYLDAFKIDAGGKKLSQVILEQIQKCKTGRDAITLPLQEAVSNQKQQVEQLFIDLQQLTVYMKTDMMSRLGLMVTYSDSDGD